MTDLFTNPPSPASTCRPSPVRDAARRMGLPWEFAAMDCPVHGTTETEA